MRVENRPITSLRPYPGNPRINDQAVDAVAESIRRFGFRVPIIIDRDGVIIAGHTRHKAALALGLTEVPVHVAEDLSPEQVRALRVVDNKCAERSEWDLDLLTVEVEAIQAAGLDLDLTALGFDADELDRLLETEREGLIDPDHIPAPPDAATTRRGDLWILGDHRLLCGDSADAADVDRLLEGQPVQLVHTDPPYNVHAEPRTKNAMAAGLTSFGGNAVAGTTAKLRAKDRPILNDCMSDEDFAAALTGWFGTIGRVLEPGRAFYIWGGFFNLGSYPPALAASELHFAQTIIWVKVHPSLTRKDFMLNHEWCFYGWRAGAAHQFFGPASAPDVWLLGRYRSGEVGLNGGVRLVGADGSRIDIIPPDDAERREIQVGEEPVLLHGANAVTDVWSGPISPPGHRSIRTVRSACWPTAPGSSRNMRGARHIMPADPRQLRPADLVRLLNSSVQGAVLSERQLHRHRVRAGFRIGNGRTVDLFRYLSWLADLVHAPPAEPTAEGYDGHRDAAAARSRQRSLSGRDIGELPPIADPARKETAARSFRSFCERYFPTVFHLGWSEDHLRLIARIETAVLEGGLFAMAAPRGQGKTVLAECACLWALLYGHRDFVCLIGSDESHAADMLESLKTELETNGLLLADFPEAVFPIHALDGIPHRAGGQLYRGERTHIGWTAKEIVLPTMPGSPASGAIVKVAGLTGRIRGLKFKRPDGRAVRPSLVVLDDPQTDESARSLSQCQHREAILAGAVLGLAGPGRKISGIMPCTIIHPGDMADRILDRDLHPEWNGERTRMVYAFPTATKRWEEYAKIRAESLRAGRGLSDATAFYIAHRAEMDAGARVAWEARFNHDEVSAIQHAMNLKLQDEVAFWAEYQNEPLPSTTSENDTLSVDQIMAKVNGHDRGVVPLDASHLTAFIDVQQKALFWVVCGWSDEFTGYVLDYGTWPDQRRSYFTLRDLRITLASTTKTAGLEGQLYAGLEAAVGHLMGRRWRRDDGAELAIERLLIDANWGQSTDVVYQFCRQSAHAAILMPSHGRFVGAASMPFSDYRRKRGDRVGLNWRIPAVVGRHTVRHLLFDTNFWKSFIHARLTVPMGESSCLSLYGHDPERHRRIAEHLVAEYQVRTEGRGRVVDEWRLKPDGGDNHWLDGVVGCAVGASMLGVGLAETSASVPARERPRLRLSDLRGAVSRC